MRLLSHLAAFTLGIATFIAYSYHWLDHNLRIH